MAEGGAGFGGSVGRERGTGMEEHLGQDWKRLAAEADMRCCDDMLMVRGHIISYISTAYCAAAAIC